mmetsp:Transcript_86109/g.186090  ORF Transcript_86109/g.186090 Transcript_86109/m.186090 type:complete len:201 (+) Transcript_86109:1157-1759(+)
MRPDLIDDLLNLPDVLHGRKGRCLRIGQVPDHVHLVARVANRVELLGIQHLAEAGPDHEDAPPFPRRDRARLRGPGLLLLVVRVHPRARRRRRACVARRRRRRRRRLDLRGRRRRRLPLGRGELGLLLQERRQQLLHAARDVLLPLLLLLLQQSEELPLQLRVFARGQVLLVDLHGEIGPARAGEAGGARCCLGPENLGP